MLPQSIAPRTLIAEIGLLIDYVSGRGTRTFLPHAAPDAEAAQFGKLGPDPIAAFLRVCRVFDMTENGTAATIPADPASEDEIAAWERLVLTRDWLNSLASPVTGDTIAFSILVGGYQAGQPAQGDLALAFPLYAHEARKMARMFTYTRAFAFALTVVIILVSAWALFGQAALGALADLRTRTELSEQEMMNKEAALNPARPAAGVPFLRYCDPKDDKTPFAYQVVDAEQLDFCRRRDDLTARRDAAYQTLNFWFLAGLPRVGMFLKPTCTAKQLHDKDPGCSDPSVTATRYTISDDAARALLGVMAGSILPLLMAMLGSTTAVLRDYVRSVRERVLAPRDRRLFQIRGMLGVVAGVVGGFLFLPAASSLPLASVAGSSVSGAIASATALASTASLTAPAVGFLAGFSVDLFFQFVAGLGQSVFRDKAAK